ncbi:MAG: hypothetical protein R2752_06485 [Vicinamibacterales bacterium]
MRDQPAGATPWWTWPTILSLDAPVVAMLWQGLLARLSGVPLGWAPVVVLGLSVWLSYVLDRWLEAWRLDPADVRTARHAFHQRARWPLAAAWAVVFAIDLVLAFAWLDARMLIAGALLLPPVLAYLLSHQLVHRDHPWRVPKEICIAALLGGGVVVFPAAVPDPPLGALVAPLAGFVLVALANCILISTWERGVDLSQGQTSLALQHPAGARFGRRLAWGLAVGGGLTAVALRAPTGVAAGCAAASAALLLVIDRLEARTGPEPARVLADAALMTPLAILAAGWTIR